ncbi:NAD(P)-dependent oxidoreductase [Rhodovastum atsumiense]|uniref:NAD(P)-dependent oxidoreductase n=1 Tax=Rhodovastum atsumiense TaxID=504468 RepID=A0A5M6ITZ1_9PROT|nr:NAD(P)-dependent oxidoreductase [Rhodovastum atsumiense]KAA5611732.1 NAD(P)-dependent oxidoreductase [Rhodovastum atsumiense]CAH2604312.1 NAD(P)-dependent oxidoreductase [Rhodovastum atsumiense]
MRIAVIAPGAMGAAVARRLAGRGAEVAVTLQGRGPASATRAQGLPTQESEAALAGWADLVLSILPPGEALALARRLAPVLCPRGAAVVFADCNAVSPETVQAVAAALPGLRFADIGIIGGPPKGDDAGPRFYVSGEPAGALLALRAHGLDVRAVEGGIGAASALKLSYAGITKGLTALGSAMALGAARAGVAGPLIAELAESQPALLAYLRRGVPDMFGKAYRWVAEMEEIAAFLDGMPFGPAYLAAARHYEAIARDAAAPAEDGETARLAASFAAPAPGGT